MAYYRDFSQISIRQYAQILSETDLVPSRMILKERTAERFRVLEDRGIRNLQELQSVLKTKVKLQAFSEQSGLREDYLTILIREVNSLKPKPSRLADFPCLTRKLSESLAQLGIKNTKQLYDHILTGDSREKLCEQSGISMTQMISLASLCDLCRVRWVNHTFACILLELGFESAESLSRADLESLYEGVNRINKERGFYNHKIGVHDIQLVIDAASDVPVELKL